MLNPGLISLPRNKQIHLRFCLQSRRPNNSSTSLSVFLSEAHERISLCKYAAAQERMQRSREKEKEDKHRANKKKTLHVTGEYNQMTIAKARGMVQTRAGTISAAPAKALRCDASLLQSNVERFVL